MNFAATTALAFAMSTDAFAAAVAKGAALRRVHLKQALRTGAIFGVIEALTPLLGWAVGQAAASYVAAWDHWIAFILLGLLGAHMVHEGLSVPDDDDDAQPTAHGFWRLAITGFATSIDAMVVGVGLAFLDVNIMVTAAAIGLATFTMVTIGTLVGKSIGAVLGKRAEVGGGLVLIAIGALILFEHLSAAG